MFKFLKHLADIWIEGLVQTAEYDSYGYWAMT